VRSNSSQPRRTAAIGLRAPGTARKNLNLHEPLLMSSRSDGRRVLVFRSPADVARNNAGGRTLKEDKRVIVEQAPGICRFTENPIMTRGQFCPFRAKFKCLAGGVRRFGMPSVCVRPIG
jgi:hypothetical protein